MKSRLVASVVIGVAVVLGASGCAMLSPQATTIPYSPGDGINVNENGAPLLIRNALVVADQDGTTGNLVAAVINATGDAQTLTIQVGDGSSSVTKTLDVDANTVSSLGENVDPIRLDGIDAKPGSTLSISFQSGDSTPVVADVPVLNNGEKYYDGLVPSPSASSESSPSPTP